MGMLSLCKPALEPSSLGTSKYKLAIARQHPMIHVLTHNPQLQFLHSSHSHNTFVTRPPSTMPLYNHAVRTTPVTSLHTTLHFETFICDSTLCLFLVSLSPETPTSRKVNTMVSNKHLFAHPAELTGPKLAQGRGDPLQLVDLQLCHRSCHDCETRGHRPDSPDWRCGGQQDP
jgi:hypothetical protein